MLLGRDTSDETNGFEQKHRTCLPQSALPWKTSKSASYSSAQRFTATHRQLSRGISFTHPQRNARLRARQKQQQTHLQNRCNRHSTCTQYNTHPSPCHRTTVPWAKGSYYHPEKDDNPVSTLPPSWRNLTEHAGNPKT
jgi:hypothetical protein